MPDVQSESAAADEEQSEREAPASTLNPSPNGAFERSQGCNPWRAGPAPPSFPLPHREGPGEGHPAKEDGRIIHRLHQCSQTAKRQRARTRTPPLARRLVFPQPTRPPLGPGQLLGRPARGEYPCTLALGLLRLPAYVREPTGSERGIVVQDQPAHGQLGGDLPPPLCGVVDRTHDHGCRALLVLPIELMRTPDDEKPVPTLLPSDR